MRRYCWLADINKIRDWKHQGKWGWWCGKVHKFNSEKEEPWQSSVVLYPLYGLDRFEESLTVFLDCGCRCRYAICVIEL
ncbi:hypothetical protein BSKO_02851 [Bryopsis sp. KO-2023]|nr:hypothetical protein BSKO_02851 [Bryopsis sp. KO-2023]